MNHNLDPKDRSIDETAAAIEAVYSDKILDLEMNCNSLSMEVEAVRSQLEVRSNRRCVTRQGPDIQYAICPVRLGKEREVCVPCSK
jgi:hypothetical protein